MQQTHIQIKSRRGVNNKYIKRKWGGLASQPEPGAAQDLSDEVGPGRSCAPAPQARILASKISPPPAGSDLEPAEVTECGRPKAPCGQAGMAAP